MGSLRQDLAHAVRRLARRRLLTLVATATLAVGIAGATAIFSVAHAVILRPLPYAEPDRLALVWQSDLRRGQPFVEMSYPTFRDWRAGTPSSRTSPACRARTSPGPFADAASPSSSWGGSCPGTSSPCSACRRLSVAPSSPKTTGGQPPAWSCSVTPCGATASARTPSVVGSPVVLDQRAVHGRGRDAGGLRLSRGRPALDAARPGRERARRAARGLVDERARPPQARRLARAGAPRHGGARHGLQPRDVPGARDHGRRDAAGRGGVRPHAPGPFRAAGRGRPRPAGGLRQRRRAAARPGERAGARAGPAHGARREPRAARARVVAESLVLGLSAEGSACSAPSRAFRCWWRSRRRTCRGSATPRSTRPRSASRWSRRSSAVAATAARPRAGGPLALVPRGALRAARAPWRRAAAGCARRSSSARSALALTLLVGAGLLAAELRGASRRASRLRRRARPRGGGGAAGRPLPAGRPAPPVHR